MAASSKSFFGSFPHPFESIETSEDGGIPTMPFLESCSDIVPFLDILGSTAFYPVKTDIQGNIDKLKKHFLSNPMLDTLQKLVQLEVDAGTTEKSGSATDALMWLKRALHFITAFLGAVQSVACSTPWLYCTAGFIKGSRGDSDDDEAAIVVQIKSMVTSFAGLLKNADDYYTSAGLPN